MNRINAVVAILFAFYVFIFPQWIHAADAVDGKTLFRDNCKSCHTIGKGKLVGPDLKDIEKKRSAVWLRQWIKSSKSLLEAKDPDAIALFEEYNKVPMSEFPALSDATIETILGYIRTESNPVVTVASVPPLPQAGQMQAANPSQWYTVPSFLLLGIIALLLLVIYHLSRLIKQLTAKLANAYIDNRSFF